LDDFTLGGPIDYLIAKVKIFEVDAHSLDLSLNHFKCEIIGLFDLARSFWVSLRCLLLRPHFWEPQY